MSRVLVIGAGGLGHPLAFQLAVASRASAAIEHLTVLDADRAELSNLHRQVLFTEADVGRPKAQLLADVLDARFGLTVEARNEVFTRDNRDFVSEFDLVFDGTDRFETKLLISDACIDAGVPYVFAGVVGYEGQVLGTIPHRTACLRCLFDEAPPPGAAPTCAEVGIVGPIAGMVAARQAEVGLSILAGHLELLNGLWIYDGRRDVARSVPLRPAKDCKGCGSRTADRGWLAPVSEELRQCDRELDLSGEVCPQTFSRTRRALEGLAPGNAIWIRLTSDESARNVPASAVAAGYRLLASESDGTVHRVLLERPMT